MSGLGVTDALALVPMGLRLLAGLPPTPADLALLGNDLGKVLTPANIEAAVEFVKAHGPAVVHVVEKIGGKVVVWLKAHEGPDAATLHLGEFEAGGEWYPALQSNAGLGDSPGGDGIAG